MEVGVLGHRGGRLNAAWARRIYFGMQRWRGEPVEEVCRELDASQAWPRERLIELQWERMRALYRHAYETVPFYRMRWSAAGFDAESMRSRGDWARLPALEKRDLREHGATLHSSQAPPGLKATTSGSSGTPIAVLRSHRSWAHAHANVFRGWAWHGIRVGDRYAYLWGLALDASGRRQAGWRDWVFNRERLSAFEITPERVRAYYARLLERRPRFAFGYPSAVTHFAEEVTALGLDGRAIGLRAV